MNADLLLQHFNRISEAPDAVARLRRFILDLAVRGELVERSGSWSEVSLGAIGNWGSGGTPNKSHPEYYGGNIPWLVIGDLNDGLVDRAETQITEAGLKNSSAKMVDPGTILIAMYGSIGKLGITGIRCATNQAIAYCVPDLKQVSRTYLMIILRSLREELLGKGHGVAQQNISQKILKAHTVMLPTLPEQHRVVAKVDELMALCDQLEAANTEREARRDQLVAASLNRVGTAPAEELPEDARFHLTHLPRLSTSIEHIKELRQTILSLAVRGRLVAQDPKDEPAAELLKRIRADAARLVKEGAPRQKAASLAAVDLEQAPFELPSGWSWARFPELGTFGRGKSKHRPRNDATLFEGGTHLVIQTGDVARSKGVIQTHTSKYNDVGLAQSKKWPAGTMCITIAANIADSGILSFDACFPDSVVGFIPASGFQDARYFEYFVRTAKANLLEFAPATAQKNINLEILSAVLIPLPPLAEQHRIVAKVDELMALCDKLETQITATETDSRRLLEAVLRDTLAPALAEAA